MTEATAESGQLESPNTIGQAERIKLSRYFLLFAWLIEISAASVGILLAVSRLAAGGGNFANALLGAIPFFAVAIMELTKIPLATVIFHTATRRWKAAFTVALVLSMGITFETFFIGFEQYQAQILKEIRPLKNEVEKIRTSIKQIDDSISASSNIKSNEASAKLEYRQQVEGVNKKYQSIIDGYIEDKKRILDKYEGSAEASKAAVNALRESRSAFLIQIEQEKQARTRQLENTTELISESSRTKSASINQAIQNAEEEKKYLQSESKKQIALLISQEGDELNDCTFSCSAIRARYADRRTVLNEDTTKKIAEINAKIDGLRKDNTQSDNSAELSQRTTEINSNYEKRISGIQSRIDKIDSEIILRLEEIERIRGDISPSDKEKIDNFDEKITVQKGEKNNELLFVQKEFESRQLQFGEAAAAISGNTADANSQRSKLAPKCSELNEAVAENTVYRLAMQIFSIDDVCDLTQRELTITQFIWFGSLALITSALGTVLAFAGLVIKYPSRRTPNRVLAEIAGLMRRTNKAFALMHRRLTRPKIKEIYVDREIVKEVVREVPVEHVIEKTVEVTKEVPVEKVVFRDVPVEIVHKELIHVPLFTQDISLMKKND